MKIFISHASANKGYGDALVDLLRGVGVKDEEIIYTSNTAYGIPLSQNIFNWLKTQITDKPFVIYLLSQEYYASIPCLNEMGAAWVIENQHAILFAPEFNIGGKEFQNGAIDPREIGFYMDDQERLLTFVDLLKDYFTVSKNSVIIHQAINKFVMKVAKIKNHPEPVSKATIHPKDNLIEAIDSEPSVNTEVKGNNISDPIQQFRAFFSGIGLYQKFVNDITSNKLKVEELILLQYIIDSGKVKLGTGWQTSNEQDRIRNWEEVNELSNLLSRSYENALNKFDVRGYTEVSALTSSGNPKEVVLKNEIASNILNLPAPVLNIINKAISENEKQNIDINDPDDDDLPF
jgi:hypothetical protein